MNADADASQEYSTVNPASGAESSEWRDHRNRTRSDSGWISDNNSWSSKDDDSVLESAALNSLSGRLQDVLLLEDRVSSTSFSDEIYQESRLSSISSQTLSTPDENEPSSSTSKGCGSRVSRSMKAIPVRFMTLLRSAAEHAARQRIRLEGCSLIVQSRPQNSYNVYNSNDQLMFVQPMYYQTEFTGDTYPCASSWYIPGDYRYVQNRYQQSPESYVQQIQYHLVHEGFVQGHYFVQSADSFHQEDSIPPNLGFQNPFSQDSERDLKPSSYNEISPSEHFGTNHQYSRHGYHSFTYAMPTYTIPVASTNGNCIVNSACDANAGIIA